ncbi:MAG TPA: hypothetical protein ENN90_04910 [Mariniphaga anaerophila]|uniref:Zinc-finger n=1 Tax=Mariniphaga anaerophila TaxID=1484053 RepID=A0A831PPT7_9BACT|nr:hypothetical protein [Mariniphaga anaerophila]
MHILFLSCLKATELIEKKLHFKLSYTERLQLKVHKMMCDACRMYEKQSDFLEKGIEHQQKADLEEIDIEKLKKEIHLHLHHH